MLDVDSEWPFLTDSIEYLEEKQAIDGREYRRLTALDQLRVIGSSTLTAAADAARLRSLLVDAAKAGDSTSEFRARIKDEITLRKSDANRILRTNTKQAYLDGMTKTLEKPHVSSTFGFVMYVATHDGRTRDSHRELDGFVVEVGTREYHVLKRALADWNCRCSLIPLTEKQAKARGIKTYQDLPSEVRRLYGSAI